MKKRLTTIILVTAIPVLLLVTVHIALIDYYDIQRMGLIRQSEDQIRSWRHLRHKEHIPSQTDINAIQPWMTFQYINNVFRLPPEYLKTNLSITDKHYPNITIAKIAGKDKKVQASYIETLKEAIQHFIETHKR